MIRGFSKRQLKRLANKELHRISKWRKTDILALLQQSVSKNLDVATREAPIFPISSDEELQAVENKMANDINEYNWDGVQGKKAFKNYPAFIKGIFKATSSLKEGMSPSLLVDELRTAFRLNEIKY